MKKQNQNRLRNSFKNDGSQENSFEDEYGAKKQNKKTRNLNLSKSKYFKTNDMKKSKSRGRR